jgi:DNA-binding MarR family transcriptional regulator
MTPTKADSVHIIERELAVLLHRVRRTSLDNARLLHADLQPAAYHIFLFVVDNEPTRASDVVEHLGIDKGAVSRQVSHLEDLGLIERSCDLTDRRVQTLVLTTEGKARVAAVAERRRSEFENRLSGWSAENLAQFSERLARYNASLDT